MIFTLVKNPRFINIFLYFFAWVVTVNAQNMQNDPSSNSYAEYELQRLRDPATGQIPSNIRALELEYAATLPGYIDPVLKDLPIPNSLTWSQRGPWNQGGRTRAFAIDVSNSNKLLAGSTSGGMWMSTNGGNSWSSAWGLEHQSISCISQDTRPGKTNTWYAGTGEGAGQSAGAAGANYWGNGIYKSTDGGQTWSSLSSTTNTPNTPQTFDNLWDVIWNVAADGSDSVNNVVYAAAFGTILMSKDGGTSWDTLAGGITPYSDFTDVAVSPSGIVYATLSSDGSQKGIWRGNDTGWTNITPSGFPATYGRIKIGISPSDENQVYFFASTTTGSGTADTNHLGKVEWNSLWKLHYDTSGGKWYNLSPNLPTTGGPFDKQNTDGGKSMIIKVHPSDTSVVFLGGTNLYRSDSGFFTDSATTLIGGYQQGTSLPTPDNYPDHHSGQHEIAFVPSDPKQMYSATNGGIYKTANDTASTVVWTSLNNGYLTSMFHSVSMDHTATGDSTLIGGAQDNGSWFLNSNDPQASGAVPLGETGSYCAVSNNKLGYYLSTQNGKMIKATLNAAGAVQSFDRIDPIGGTGYQFINPFVLDPNSMSRMYLAGGKNLWRNDALHAIPLSGNWDTISLGWTKFPDTVPAAGAKITAVAISKNPANRVYYGTSNRHVYRIDNAHSGTPSATDITWIASFPDGFPTGGNVSCIAIDPLDAAHVMVAFSNYNVYSIFYSTNASSPVPSWSKVAGNLEQGSNSTGSGNGPSIRWLSILPVTGGTVYLAATSTGIYATDTLMGTSTVWVQQGASTIGNSICNMIDHRASDGSTAVATHSRGIFTTHITSINDVFAGVEEPLNSLFQFSVHPNPFHASASIRFTLNSPTSLSLHIYNMDGKLIHAIAEKKYPSGPHLLEFSGEDLSPGVYSCTVKTKEGSQTKKILLIK